MQINSVGNVWAITFSYPDGSEAVMAAADTRETALAWGEKEVARMFGRRPQKWIPKVMVHQIQMVEGK